MNDDTNVAAVIASLDRRTRKIAAASLLTPTEDETLGALFRALAVDLLAANALPRDLTAGIHQLLIDESGI
jgi:hypothetical protein